MNLSKWLRGEVKAFNDFEDLIIPLRAFFSSQEPYHPVKNHVTGKNPNQSSKLTVPLMFAAKLQPVDSSEPLIVRPPHAVGATSDNTSHCSSRGGQLSIGESFGRGVKRSSHAGADENHKVDNDPSISIYCDDEDFLASTQDPNELESTDMSNSLGESLALPNSCLESLDVDSILREISMDWNWNFVGDRISSFRQFEHFLSDISPSRSDRSDDVVMLQIVEYAAHSSEPNYSNFDASVKRKFFSPLKNRMENQNFSYCDGESIPYLGVRIVDWCFDDSTCTLLDPSDETSFKRAVVYSEEWDTDDRVVYGILRLAPELGGNVIAVKILATDSKRSMWFGASWAHVEVAFSWYNKGMKSPPNKLCCGDKSDCCYGDNSGSRMKRTRVGSFG